VSEDFFFGGGASGSDMHPLLQVLTLQAVAMAMFVPRRCEFEPAECAAFMPPLGVQSFVDRPYCYLALSLAD
jgi:hypothetical protein